MRDLSHMVACMTLDLFTALATFAFVTVITPGPNNLMLMASGTNFGFVRTIPHMLGIGLGFPLMVFCVGMGVMRVLTYGRSATLCSRPCRWPICCFWLGKSLMPRRQGRPR